MLPELEALLQLQRYDLKLMEAQRKRDEIPRRREALKAALDQAKAAHERAIDGEQDVHGVVSPTRWQAAR